MDRPVLPRVTTCARLQHCSGCRYQGNWHASTDFEEIALDVTIWQLDNHLGCLSPQGFLVAQGLDNSCAFYREGFMLLASAWLPNHHLHLITFSSTWYVPVAVGGAFRSEGFCSTRCWASPMPMFEMDFMLYPLYGDESKQATIARF